MFHKKSDSLLAIDFGLCKSVAYLYESRCTQVSFGSDFDFLPSFVAYRGYEVYTGRRARSFKYCVSCVKRLLGLTWDEYETLEKKDIFGCKVVRGTDGYPRFIVSDDGRQVSAVEVASELFRKIKDCSEREIKAPIDECYLTVPAYFNDNQREAIKTAARTSGLNVKALILEPIATVMSWYLGHEKTLFRDDEMLVFDIGHSWCDISLLKYDDKGNFSVLDTDRDPNMGEYDVDIEIMNKVCKTYRRFYGCELIPQSLPSAVKKPYRRRLLGICKDIRDTLKYTNETEVSIPSLVNVANDTEDEDFKFCRDDIDSIVDCLFMKRIDGFIDRITRKPDQTREMIKKVFMIGESSLQWLVREGLKKRFPHAEFPDINPETSVAEGTLRIALDQIQSREISHGSISCSYGLLVGNEVVILLQKGTHVPCESGPFTLQY